VIAKNRMVLIVPPSSADVNGFDDLRKVKTIAIGHPKTVPAGKYASQVLSHAAGMGKQRLIYGTNVRQVLDYVERGEVSAGLVYQTDAMIAGGKVRVVAKADESWHDPIVYPAVVVSKSANAPAAAEFLKFLQSETAQKILEGKGFLPATR
jgi:molybdate transport system substrate-binding protein